MTGLDIFKQRTYFEVWYGDLENFIAEFYSLPWDFASAEDISNDTYQSLSVSKKEPYEASRIIQDWEDGGKFYPTARIILWDLCRRGAIPEGEYLVHISW